MVALAVLGWGAAAASAVVWEPVKHFAPENIPSPPPKKPSEFPEDTQLGGVSGMAVNRTGMGGVTPGTLYAAGYNKGAVHVARFSPGGEFELDLKGCGPKSGGSPPLKCPPIPAAPSTGIDVDINQATGDVYVFDGDETPVIRVYKANGISPIAQFGELEATGTIATSPAKFHGAKGVGGIAVNDEGVVLLFDLDKENHHRLMIFKPKTPGVFTEYEYGGEILGGTSAAALPQMPVLDDAGNIYTAEEGAIEMHSSIGAPLCKFDEPKRGITSITVDPVSKEVLYYNYKDRRIHQLGPCSEGKFAPIASGEFSAAPPRSEIMAMALNPTLPWQTGRPGGILYAGAPEECPAIGACAEEAIGQSSLGYIFAPPVSHEPVVESEFVSKVRQTSGTLNAMVNPKGASTTYVFQYLTLAEYEAGLKTFTGATEVPLGGGVLSPGQQAVQASVTVSGLSPDTEYVYRVIASSKEGSDEGSAQSFRTFPLTVGTLVDGRAYELVSPVQKNGGEVLPSSPGQASCGTECKPGAAANRFPAVVAADGNSVAYQGQPFYFNDGAVEYDEYVSTRSASGWQTANLSPPLVGQLGETGFQPFSLDSSLGSAIVYAHNEALAPAAPPNYRNLFLEQTSNRFGLSPLLTNANATLHRPPGSGTEALELIYAGASSDYSRQFFEANDALTGEAEDGGASKFNLYEWFGGQLHAVNLPSGKTEAIPGAAFGSGFLLGSLAPPAANLSHAISSDGSRVFWTGADGKTYVRIGGAQTLEIPGPGSCKESTPSSSRVCFLTASANGSEVLLSNGQLYELNAGGNAYEATTDLTAGKGGFQGISGQSESLSHLYFVDTEVLTGEEQNSAGDKAQPGGFNLYSWQGGVSKFVATLLSVDNTETGDWSAAAVRRSAEASPDGRWLAVSSKAELTGINSIGACVLDPDQNKYVDPGPCREVFLYDSQSGKLSCPSCNPTGAPPLGASILRTQLQADGWLSQPRYLTNSGRLLFDSRDALSALDTNNGVEDVYQFEPQGVGSCTEAGGCVSLISNGRGAFDANFLAMDSSGDNVFFTTRNQLLPPDVDQLLDVYDARAGGGVAEPEPPNVCQGEGCQPPSPPSPLDPTSSSTSVEGPGNATKTKQSNKKKNNSKKKKKQKKKSKKKPARSKRGGSK